MFNTSAVGKEEPGQVLTLQDERNYPSHRASESLSFRIFSLLSHRLDFSSHEKLDSPLKLHTDFTVLMSLTRYLNFRY